MRLPHLTVPVFIALLMMAASSRVQCEEADATGEELPRVVVVPVFSTGASGARALEVAAVVESTIRAQQNHIVLGRVGIPSARIQRKIVRARRACAAAEAAFLDLETDVASEKNRACIRDLVGRLDFVNDASSVARAFILRGTLATLQGNDDARLPAFVRALSLDPTVSLENLYLPSGDIKAIEDRQTELMFSEPISVWFKSEPAAAIYIDGTFIAVTPAKVRLGDGQHEWALRRPGFQREMGKLEIGKLSKRKRSKKGKKNGKEISKKLQAIRKGIDIDKRQRGLEDASAFWAGTRLPDSAFDIDDAKSASLAIFVRARKKSVDLVVVELKRGATVAIKSVAIDSDFLSIRPTLIKVTRELLAKDVNGPPLVTRELATPPKSKVVATKTAPSSETEFAGETDESEGLGGLAWGGIGVAATVVVVGAVATGVAAAILLAPDAAAVPERDPFSGADGQARRRAVLGF